MFKKLIGVLLVFTAGSFLGHSESKDLLTWIIMYAFYLPGLYLLLRDDFVATAAKLTDETK